MGKASDFPDLAVVLCGEERGDDLCRTRVGAVKRLEISAPNDPDVKDVVTVFAPDLGPTFYLRSEGTEIRLPANEPSPRAWCPECEAWVSPLDEKQLLKALDKPRKAGAPIWAYHPLHGFDGFPPPA